jgi:hypothetical protein
VLVAGLVKNGVVSWLDALDSVAGQLVVLTGVAGLVVGAVLFAVLAYSGFRARGNSVPRSVWRSIRRFFATLLDLS